jgi:seryl-tRNA synthetase
VPVGVDEKKNKIIKKIGNIKKFKFPIKSHVEIGEKNNQIDFKTSSRLSGSRFVILNSYFALLERALINFMLDVHTNKFSYKEISPPLLVNENVMFGTGQLPKFEEDQFEIKLTKDEERKFLIPTAEVVLTNLVRESVIDSKSLPLRYVAATPCFRKEAGSYGKDTKGMMRQHQFYKVELVSVVKPEDSLSELDRMLNCAEEILKLLEIPYQVILLS